MKIYENNMTNSTVEDMVLIADKLYEEENYREALKKFQFIAEQHKCTYSQKMLGYMLINELGTLDRIEEGWSWYKTAAQDNAEAQFLYAWHCIEEKNEKLGISYMQKAAESACKNAMYDLAGIYYHGMYGCEKNLDKSIELYESAAIAGSKDSFDDFLSARIDRDGKFKTGIYVLRHIKRFTRLMG